MTGFWAHQLTDAEARELTVENVLGGTDGWNPKTGAIRTPVTVSKETISAKALIPRDMVWLATTASQNPGDPPGLAYTTDGLKWTALARALPTPAEQKTMIDPRLVEGVDGVFHLVWSTGTKGDKGFLHASSKDLINWSDPVHLDVMAKQDALDVTAPNLFYDEVSRRYVITWASTIVRNFIQSFQEEVDDNPRLWYTTTRDFEVFSDPELLFDPNYSVRQGTIVEDRGRYVLIHNDNTWPMVNLRVSASSTPFGPWGLSSDAFTERGSAAPTAIQSGHDWWIYYVSSQAGGAGLVKTRDFRSFQDASTQVSFPEGRHPVSVLAVKRSLVDVK